MRARGSVGSRALRPTRPAAWAASCLAGVALALAPVHETAADEPPPDARVGELPFLDDEEPTRVRVDLAKVGHARRMPLMLDTGATHSVLTPRAARALGIRPRRVKPGPYIRSTALGRSIHFYIDMRSSDTGPRMFQHALLGGEFLRHFVFEIDYPARRVRFFDPDRYAVPEADTAPKTAVLPLTVVSNRPGLEIEVDGEPVTLLVDTGAPLGLTLSGEHARAAGVATGNAPPFRMWTVMGPVDQRTARVASVRIGPFEFRDLRVLVAEHGAYNLGLPGDSIVGYDLLAHFTLRFDYARRRVWLRRHPERRPTFLGGDDAVYRESGALLAPVSGGLRVFAVREGSPAAGWGLRLGDRIETPLAAEAVAARLAEGAGIREVGQEQDGGRRVAIGGTTPDTGATPPASEGEAPPGAPAGGGS